MTRVKISCSLPPEVLRLLDREAEKRRRSRSRMIEVAVSEWLREHSAETE